ncbi:MAG: alpha/beta family hydrolase [Chloroflexota bacterium]
MTTKHVSFPCGDITLEGELQLPDGKGPFPGVVVCHPHPLRGGDMENNVVVAVCQALVAKSIAALRFNFRGVGNSGGTFGGGMSEQDDVKAALDFLATAPNIDLEKIGLAGYSFGAGVALAVALQDERVGRLALVALPLQNSGWKDLKNYNKPKFVIVGEADSFVSVEQIRQNLTATQYQIIPDVNHFWWGHEKAMADRVAYFFSTS